MQKLLFFLFILSLTHSAKAYPGLEEIHEFGSNPGNLAFFRYSPKDIQDSDTPRPLIIALHGCNQSAGAIARISDWNKMADRYNFHLIYPEQQLINNPSRCFNWFRKKDFSGHKGELESIYQMILYQLKDKTCDSSKIYVYGLSAGAAMGVALMANYPHLIEAGAIFAGSAYGMAENAWEGLKVMRKPKELNPENWRKKFVAATDSVHTTYPRILIFQGKTDKVVNPGNAQELLKQFTTLHSIKDTVIDQTFLNNPELQRTALLDFEGKECIVYYEMANLGHALSVDPGEDSLQGGKTGAFSTDRDFFSTYYVVKDFGLLNSR
ncbi:MAG: PHB depolymerase family esterase [Flavobacteriales bacterium]|nr:PHB depolymerase family esterase [Flavobacteriales bacterium]